MQLFWITYFHSDIKFIFVSVYLKMETWKNIFYFVLDTNGMIFFFFFYDNKTIWVMEKNI